MLYGIDVSNWQGSVNWAKHASDGIKFAFAKATEGTGFSDGQFARNWRGMKSHDIVRGAYHFGHPKNGAKAEADHFLKVVRAQGLHDGDLLALDLEVSDGTSASHVASYARAWCDHVRQATGTKPVVYTFLSFARGGYCAGLGGYPLWIAAPSYKAGHPPMPLGPWHEWKFHQYSDNPIDKNVFNGTSKDQVRALGVGGEEDEVPIRTSLGKQKDQNLKWNEYTVLNWDVEHDDSSHTHWNGNHPGYVSPSGSWADFNVSIEVDGLTPGDQWQVQYQVFDDKDGDAAGSGWKEIAADFPASTGRQFVTGAMSKGLKKKQHVYVAVAIFPKDGTTDGRDTPKAVAGRWTIAQDKS